MRALMEFLFKVLLVLFLTSGALLVFGQILGILLQKGDMIIASTNLFKNPTLVLSAFFSLVGFSLNYIPEKKDTSFSDHPSASAGDSLK
ncbi:MAG: hypothetical protein IKG72_12885 [Bacillus sp. (in: Bacteria)]|uniref:hypothetical protein n=1 Tax=Bacillus safensis TaxID=561879 RepID=UPI0007FB4C03|nr:hypothetical protein [Bacillus safensis]MBR3380977.1 hypothetical protein [Bacillus sp. (in: firmicutes)]MCM2989383.1 hypothetical protein [Bacillus safensis]OBW51171.1 hypothetical protein A9985_11375 [Bacillus safensis]